VEYITVKKQKLELVLLNLEAGEISISAFMPASDFFIKGIALLFANKDHWKHNYSLSLKLYRCGGGGTLHWQL